MADVKISALPAATSANTTDEIPVNQSGTTRKLTVSQLLSGGGGSSSSVYSVANGRLTTESTVPVSSSDRTSQGTIYFTPYQGNQIGLYTGSAWTVATFSELSLALSSLTSGKNYDVFVDYNSGTPTLRLSAAWTDDTTRTDAIALQDGIYVKSGTATYRLVGTIRTTSTTTTEDSKTKRFVWNLYNRRPRPMYRTETATSWSYNTASYRQANSNTANQLEVVSGLLEDLIDVRVDASCFSDGFAGYPKVGVGVNSTTTSSALSFTTMTTSNNYSIDICCHYQGIPRAGYSYFAWLELGANVGTGTTWYGAPSGTAINSGQTGIHGIWFN